nr:MPS [Multipurpose vector pCAHUMO]
MRPAVHKEVNFVAYLLIVLGMFLYVDAKACTRECGNLGFGICPRSEGSPLNPICINCVRPVPGQAHARVLLLALAVLATAAVAVASSSSFADSNPIRPVTDRAASTLESAVLGALPGQRSPDYKDDDDKDYKDDDDKDYKDDDDKRSPARGLQGSKLGTSSGHHHHHHASGTS